MPESLEAESIAMPRITKRLIDTLEPDPKRELSIMDTEVRGFGVRVKPTGAASYFVRYKMPDGSERRMVAGQGRGCDPG